MGEKKDLQGRYKGLIWESRKRYRKHRFYGKSQKKKSQKEKISLNGCYSKEFIYLCSQQESKYIDT